MRKEIQEFSSQLPSATVIHMVTKAFLLAYRMIITYFNEHVQCHCPCPKFHENQAEAVYGGRKIQWLP